MNPIIIPILYSVVIINIILSAIISSRGFKKSYNILFACIAFAVAAWSFAIIGFYSDNLKQLFNWIALTHSSALFSALTLLYFSISFPEKLFKRNWIAIIPFLPFAVVTYFLFFTDSILGNTLGVAYEIHAGYIWYEGLLIAYFMASYLALFFQIYKAKTPATKGQARLIFLGCVFASLCGMVTDLILPALAVFTYTWLGPIFTLVLVALIFIAILKYNLFNIKIILTELLSIILIVTLSIEIFLETQPMLILIKTIVLLLIAVFSYFLIRSVYREVELREHVEKLAKDLEKANSSLEIANDHLKELDQLKSEFLSLATHQIRAPLTAVKGYASLILEGDYGETSKDVRDAVQTIFNSCQNLVVIVNEFLDISRIEQGRMKYEISDFSAADLVKNIITELKPNIEKAGLAADIVVVEGSSCMMHADIGKTKQVFGNLIDNAIKYTPHGSITVTVSTDNGKTRVAVKDSGIGIGKEDISKLFGKFVRAKDANKTNVIGTGLGLYVAKQMIEAQKGKIWVESEGTGKGSTFFVELPEK